MVVSTRFSSSIRRRLVGLIDEAVGHAMRRELSAAGFGAGPPPSKRAAVKVEHGAGPSPSADLVDVHEEISAVWDLHDDEDYRQDQSHWRGVGRWSDETWESIGTETWRRVNDLYRTAGRTYPEDALPVVLEWGPGGGSNLFRFADHARVLYGVDIAAKNLGETGRVLAEKGPYDFRPILLEGDPSSITNDVTEPVDLFISTSVFQHFPSQDYGVEVLRVMRALMAPRGLAYVQIRFDNGNPIFAPKDAASYREQHITATSYELSAFWDTLGAVGFVPLKIANVNTKSNYAGFYFSVPADG
jgi:hypothetical protein